MKDFEKNLKAHGIILSDKQKEQFKIYYENLVEWNEKINLTAITNKDEVYEKHFFDSLTMAFEMNFENVHLCDVGSGAGFPSIPLKIVFPTMKVTIIEALNKRVIFLKQLVTSLELENVEVLHMRAEEAAKNNMLFDVVTARAVARLNILCELCVPLVKIGGYFITPKGMNALEEVEAAKNACDILKVKLEKQQALKLYNEQAKRLNLFYKKYDKTPKQYPRAFGIIKKKPL